MQVCSPRWTCGIHLLYRGQMKLHKIWFSIPYSVANVTQSQLIRSTLLAWSQPSVDGIYLDDYSSHIVDHDMFVFTILGSTASVDLLELLLDVYRLLPTTPSSCVFHSTVLR